MAVVWFGDQTNQSWVICVVVERDVYRVRHHVVGANAGGNWECGSGRADVANG